MHFSKKYTISTSEDRIKGEILQDINFVMAATLIARTEKKTEVLIDFIEEYTEADAEDVMYFLVPGEDDDE